MNEIPMLKEKKKRNYGFLGAIDFNALSDSSEE